jgi:3-deoxy-D-manno-octulosonic-acid transferase
VQYLQIGFTFVIIHLLIITGLNLLFYSLFLWTYKTGIRLIAPWNPKARRWLEGRERIFQKITDSGIARQEEIIWMHCASLGEFEQGRPLLEMLRSAYPQAKIALTFFSPSGYEAKKNFRGADYIFYLPADSRNHAKQFLDLVRPRLVLWIKYDYWYYYLMELKSRQIPSMLVSGIFRPDQPFFKWYGKLHRDMLGSFGHIFVQTQSSQELLASVNLSSRTTISGDTRFDRVIEIASRFEPIPLIERFVAGKRVIVAGSTWKEDEEELDHYAITHPEICFVIAPHEIDESRLKEIEALFKKSIRLSRLEEEMKQAGERPNVLIIDNIGMLSRLYKYATITYVGGGFGDDGVHNVLEAAVYAKPVVMGPVIEKYVEAMELVESGGGIVIDSALEAESVFNRLLSSDQEYHLRSEASGRYVQSKKGATRKIMDYIQENRLLTN